MMLLQRTRGLNLIHCAWQVAMAQGLFIVWSWLPFNLVLDRRWPHLSNYTIYALLMTGVLGVDGLRGISRRLPLLGMNFTQNLGRSARQALTVLAVLLFYLVASKDSAVSRMFLFTFIPALFVGLFLSNRFFPSWIAHWAFKGRNRQPTLIVGDEAKAEMLQKWVNRKRQMGLDVVEIQPLQELAKIEAHLHRTKARQLLLLGFPVSLTEVEKYTRLCERLGIRLLILADWHERLGHSLVVAEDEGHQFISFQKDHLQCPINRLAKRAFDLAVAFLVCALVLPPLTLVVWLAQRFQSPGPLFFTQSRAGVEGREFRMIKFRTMHLHRAPESQQATVNDPRVFPLGRWLRRLSLDEIPQFLNVLAGEMSIVGPRPHLLAHDIEFAQTAVAYRLRQMIKPGITGLAQVRGWRGETKTERDVIQRIQSDLHYAENWSLQMDFAIVLRTVLQMVLPPPGAM